MSYITIRQTIFYFLCELSLADGFIISPVNKRDTIGSAQIRFSSVSYNNFLISLLTTEEINWSIVLLTLIFNTDPQRWYVDIKRLKSKPIAMILIYSIWILFSEKDK